MRTESRDLLLEIAHCPVIKAVLAGQPSPCSEVIHFQTRPWGERWTAEPWSGHLDRAPLLFVSSNPAAGDPAEVLSPGDLTMSSEDEAVVHTFDDAFDEGRWIGVHDGTHLRAADGKVGKFVAYWGSCRSRATEILGRAARPGLDYALTEVVHCGSQHEIGVWSAAAQCVPRYLERVLRLSPATVIIVVGAVARDIVRSMVPATADGGTAVGPILLAGRECHVLFLPHPNARGVPKGVAAALGEQAEAVLLVLRATLGD
jgi:hypothetical protein